MVLHRSVLLLIFVAELAAIVVVPDAKGELVAAGKSVRETKSTWHFSFLNIVRSMQL